MAGPIFFSFAIGGSLPAALAANWVATAWDQNSALYNAVPGTAILEQVALGWLLDVLQLPPESGGTFVTDTTVTDAPAGRLRYPRWYGFLARESMLPTQ
jgi:glutamate/tyrosine decarboxylase-like PLP-dependent enzyme